jgi:hypothetical protein
VPFVLCHCKIWSLILKDEHSLRLSENRSAEKRNEHKTGEVISDWRKLYDVECHNLYSLPNIIKTTKQRRMSCTGHITSLGQ